MCMTCQTYIALATDLPNMCSRLEPHHFINQTCIIRLCVLGIFFSQCGALMCFVGYLDLKLCEPKTFPKGVEHFHSTSILVEAKTEAVEVKREAIAEAPTEGQGAQKPSDCWPDAVPSQHPRFKQCHLNIFEKMSFNQHVSTPLFKDVGRQRERCPEGTQRLPCGTFKFKALS